MTSFSKKLIEIRFTLSTGQFSGGNTKIVRGLKCDISIDKPGLPAKNTGKGTVFGMKQEDVEKLTTLAYRPLTIGRHLVEIFAGEDPDDLHLAYRGDITQAWGDYNKQPNVNFYFEAMTGFYSSVEPIAPFSGQGGQSVSGICAGLASQMGVSFTNNGVESSVSNPYLKGTATQQAQQLANDQDFDMFLDDDEMVITQKGQPVGNENRAPLISPRFGMIGYPQFSANGLTIKSLYNPAIKMGNWIEVQSSIPKANGMFRVTSLKHQISSENPQGKWESIAEVSYIANPLF
jgi:hypothetical protein